MPCGQLAGRPRMCSKSRTYGLAGFTGRSSPVMRGRQPLERRGHAPAARAPAAGRSRPALIHDIVRYGDPRLTAGNAEVDPAAEDLSGLLADMLATCHAAPGVGLAAPQIGVNRKVAIIDLSVGADPNAVIVLVNPVVIESSG